MKKQSHGFYLGCFIANFFLANSLWAMESDFLGSWYFNVGVGRTQPITDDTNNYVATGPGWPNDRYIPDDTHGSIMGTLGGGYTWIHQYVDWFPVLSAGGQFTYTGFSKISGVIDQYSLPQFQNYSYDYQFRRQTWLAIGKADVYRFGNFLPYITAGAGISFNTTNNYNEQPLSLITPRISPGYRSETNWYLSYMAGVGIDYVICDYLWLSLEYNYGYFGYAKTGNGVDTPSLTGVDYSNENLKNKLTANNFLLSITYLPNYI